MLQAWLKGVHYFWQRIRNHHHRSLPLMGSLAAAGRQACTDRLSPCLEIGERRIIYKRYIEYFRNSVYLIIELN